MLVAQDADWLGMQTRSILGLFRKTAESIIEAGLIIADVKARIGHGAYTDWVKTSLPFSVDTAGRYMQVAATFAPHGAWIPQLAEFDASALYLLAEPRTPPAARELAIRLATEGHEISYTAAKNIIRQSKPDAEPTLHRATSTDGDKGIGAMLRLLLASIGSHLTLRTTADPDGDAVITATTGADTATARDVGDAIQSLAARRRPEPGEFAISPEPHIDWARAIGAGVASDYDFAAGSQERQDLEAAAVAELTARCRAFQPDRVPEGGDAGGLLRGYAHRSIQKECRREAERLRNGGTYHTRREKGGIVVRGYSEENG